MSKKNDGKEALRGMMSHIADELINEMPPEIRAGVLLKASEALLESTEHAEQLCAMRLSTIGDGVAAIDTYIVTVDGGKYYAHVDKDSAKALSQPVEEGATAVEVSLRTRLTDASLCHEYEGAKEVADLIRAELVKEGKSVTVEQVRDAIDREQGSVARHLTIVAEAILKLQGFTTDRGHVKTDEEKTGGDDVVVPFPTKH